MKYGDLTYEEIHDFACQGWLAIVPTGCTEQQGPHLPVDFDTWLAERVTLSASEKAEKEFGIHSVVLFLLPDYIISNYLGVENKFTSLLNP